MEEIREFAHDSPFWFMCIVLFVGIILGLIVFEVLDKLGIVDKWIGY